MPLTKKIGGGSLLGPQESKDPPSPQESIPTTHQRVS